MMLVHALKRIGTKYTLLTDAEENADFCALANEQGWAWSHHSKVKTVQT